MTHYQYTVLTPCVYALWPLALASPTCNDNNLCNAQLLRKEGGAEAVASAVAVAVATRDSELGAMQRHMAELEDALHRALAEAAEAQEESLDMRNACVHLDAALRDSEAKRYAPQCCCPGWLLSAAFLLLDARSFNHAVDKKIWGTDKPKGCSGLALVRIVLRRDFLGMLSAMADYRQCKRQDRLCPYAQGDASRRGAMQQEKHMLEAQLLQTAGEVATAERELTGSQLSSLASARSSSMAYSSDSDDSDGTASAGGSPLPRSHIGRLAEASTREVESLRAENDAIMKVRAYFSQKVCVLVLYRLGALPGLSRVLTVRSWQNCADVAHSIHDSKQGQVDAGMDAHVSAGSAQDLHAMIVPAGNAMSGNH